MTSLGDATFRPVPARPAASLLLLRDDPFRVLMVRRHANASFPAALVFPGGVVEPADHAPDWLSLVTGAEDLPEADRAFRIAALRETFEETGIIATGDGIVEPGTATNGFRDHLALHPQKLGLAALVPFSHWITPEMHKVRFDTYFFLCRAPDGQDGVCDGRETVALDWIEPRQALADHEAGTCPILFPTRLNLRRLAESPDVASALGAAARRPLFTVRPRVEQRAGGIALVIPPEAGYDEIEEFRPN